jgi:hypothetical protein
MNTYRFECVLLVQAENQAEAWQELSDELDFLSGHFGNVVGALIVGGELSEGD